MRSLLFFMVACLVAQTQAQASCEVVSPVRLTPSETAQFQAKGYDVKVVRKLFHHSRFLGTYEYYVMKHPEQMPGQLFLNAILEADDAQPFNGMVDLTFVSKREFRLMVQKSSFVSVLAINSSAPWRFARSKQDLMNANFSSLPACR